MSSHGELNASPRRRKNGPSACRCCCYVAVAVVFAIFISFGSAAVYGFIVGIRYPHMQLYANASTAFIVRPLIDRKQAFDLAVTVWLRAPHEEEAAYQKLLQDKKPVKEVTSDVADVQETSTPILDLFNPFQSLSSALNMEEDEDILEVPIFSQIVFRGLHMTDKGVSADVSFRVPTIRFYEKNLTMTDLRGSIVLIPLSPSPLDYFVNYSSWVPPEVKRLPLRAWPFPLGSSETGEPSLVDLALDSIGISLPLLEFFEDPPCSSPDPDLDLNSPDDEHDHSIDFDGEFAEGEDEDVRSKLEKSIASMARPPVAQGHPYIVTRTQLRLIDETSRLSLKEYNKQHRTLKTGACRLPIPNSPPRRHLCTRDYKTNGHWETRFQLGVPASRGKNRTEWAYAPFISHLAQSSGPADLIRIPVTRQNCDEPPNSKPGVEDEEYVDVTWHISFSGRSAAKARLADQMVRKMRVMNPHNASDYSKVMAQDSAELWNGVFGHRFYDDAHPRRRFVLGAARWINQILAVWYDMRYWYNLSSTVGVSIPAALFDMAAFAVSTLPELFSQPTWEQVLITGFLISFVWFGTKWFKLKTVLRLEVYWTTGRWMPVWKRLKPTHSERASIRTDARTTPVTVALIFATVVTFLFFTTFHHDPLIISALHPEPDPEDWSKRKSDLVTALETLGTAGEITSYILQLILNHRRRTFAGGYKITALFFSASIAIDFLLLVPAIVGRYDARPGLPLGKLLMPSIATVILWQAFTLPKPTLAGLDDDDD